MTAILDRAESSTPSHGALGPIFTFSNVLTLSRLIGAIFLLGFAWDWAALTLSLVIAALAITDWFDGWFARRWNQTSELGRMMDPVADRVLMFGAMVLLVSLDGVGWRFGLVLVLLREVSLSIVMPSLFYFVGADQPEVKWTGKAATFFALLLIVGEAAFAPITGRADFTFDIAWLAVAAMSLMSAFQYIDSSVRLSGSLGPSNLKD